MAFFAGLPLLVSMPEDLLGGWLTDHLSQRATAWVGRCGLGAARVPRRRRAALISAALSPTPFVAAMLIAVATGVTMFTLGAAWGTVIEVGRNHVGVVGATMNSVGNLVAMLNPLIVAYRCSGLAAGRPALRYGRPLPGRHVCWTLIDPTQPVFAEAARPVIGQTSPALGASSV